MKHITKILIGMIILGTTTALTLPNMPLSSWGQSLIQLLKGGITMSVIMIGLVLTIMGFNELKE